MTALNDIGGPRSPRLADRAERCRAVPPIDDGGKGARRLQTIGMAERCHGNAIQRAKFRPVEIDGAKNGLALQDSGCHF